MALHLCMKVRGAVRYLARTACAANHRGMSSLQAQHCLATGAVQHRINHLLRTIPGGELADYGDIMAKYDAALLGLPRRFVRRLQLPDHAAGLIGLPLAAGGLGYRTWRSTADCAYLAAYMHTSHHFPKLFPHLADRFPPILDLLFRLWVSLPLRRRSRPSLLRGHSFASCPTLLWCATVSRVAPAS